MASELLLVGGSDSSAILHVATPAESTHGHQCPRGVEAPKCSSTQPLSF